MLYKNVIRVASVWSGHVCRELIDFDVSRELRNMMKPFLKIENEFNEERDSLVRLMQEKIRQKKEQLITDKEQDAEIKLSNFEQEEISKLNKVLSDIVQEGGELNILPIADKFLELIDKRARVFMPEGKIRKIQMSGQHIDDLYAYQFEK